MKNILIIDSDQENIEKIREIAKDLKINFFTANCEKEASLILGGEIKINLLIAEIFLDGINVLDYIEKIREENPDVPIIATNSKDSFDLEKKARTIGVTSYFSKPVGINEIKEMIVFYLK